ncbi:serine hydrolase [Flavobacterium sp. NRK1]|uniref:serine hydrolase domain-containing protein n=1 Tax=Flavobacterium sp. NRK1 TaxID=2954929 RepID=UPI00209303E1|nr:serine hydrolase domain-containing protein [Flavobacterium sp. NRK1]MCO6146861.1 beta-lactamase family protein [Flavobacterium sp. NRK1]
MKRLFVFFLLTISLVVYPQYNFKVADSVLATFNKPGSPGVYVLACKNGKVVYNNKGGYANIAAGETINEKTLFNIASDTKQFTAACIVMLEQKGKLKFDDKLSKYFPDFPEYANKITIQDLLYHTTGLKDYRTLVWIAGRDEEYLLDKDIRKYLAMNDVNFEPGTEFSYSNSNYWFLGQIVEQVSKMPLAEFAEKEIFKPLKMNNTHFVRDITKLKNVAIGYNLEDGKYEVCDTDNGVFGGSGILSAADDMLKWLSEMNTKKVLGTAFWNGMFNGKRYEIQENLFYSNGLEFSTYSGKNRISHGGDLDGYHSIMSYFPEEDLDIIVFTNRGDFNVHRMHSAIASEFLGYKFKWPAGAGSSQSAKLSEEVLYKYTGLYEAEQMVFEITAKDNTLNILQVWDNSVYSLQPVKDNLFTFSEAGASFLFDEITNGKAQVMQITQSGQKISFKRIEKYNLPDYSKYTGRFSCESLNAEYTFFVKDGKMFYNINGGKDLSIGPLDKDILVIDRGEVTFHRNPDGTLSGFTLNHERVKNLEFVKI